MSRKLIQSYLDETEQLLLNCSNAYIEEYSAVILTTERANLRIRIHFAIFKVAYENYLDSINN